MTSDDTMVAAGTGTSDGGFLLDIAAKAASFNVILQVSMRLSSFVLNGFVLRYVQAELLGVVNLRLTLLYNTILFLSREPLRKAALSKEASSGDNWRHVLNLMWLAVPLGVVCSILLSLLWVSPLLQQPDIPLDVVGVVLYSLSAILELTVEPLCVLGQNYHYVSIKVVAESSSQVFRCIIISVGVVLFPDYYGVLMFGIGRVAYSCLYLIIYYGYFIVELSKSGDHNLPIKSIMSLIPTKHNNRFQSLELLTISWSFFKQSFLKQLLTDGERYIMTILGVLSFAEQGVYDIVNNLGSLVARFLFLPIEESFYIFFAHLLVRGEKSIDQKRESVITASNTLSFLLKLVSIIGLVILVFGYNYSYLALDLYGGSILSQGVGPSLLKCYCVYVLFLAVNGITECFMFAVMSHTHINSYNRTMLIFSGVFLVSTTLLTRVFGSAGFIMANCINMLTRTIHSCHFIQHFFSTISHYPLISSLPSMACVISLIVSFIITRISEISFCCDISLIYRLIHIGVGGTCLLAVGVVIIVTEQRMVSFLIDRLPVKLQNIVFKILMIKTVKQE